MFRGILRVYNANTDFSQSYKDSILNTSRPVILSHGIHSDLFSWKDFATELSQFGRDSWTIEMVGGPTIDSDCTKYTCPNYTFQNLTEYYWPALIAGILKYSSQNKSDYIGYSLGCSAALESLKLNQGGKTNAGRYFNYSSGQYLLTDLPANPVETFVGVACPGNFTQLPTLMKVFNLTKPKMFADFESQKVYHVTDDEIRLKTVGNMFTVLLKDPGTFGKVNWPLVYLSSLFGGTPMSTKIYDEFYDWINNPAKPNLGAGVNLTNFLIIQGKNRGTLAYNSLIVPPTNVDNESDTIVPNEDNAQTCNNIISLNKYYASFDGRAHAGSSFFKPIYDAREVKNLIKKFIAKKTVEQNPDYTFNSNCSKI